MTRTFSRRRWAAAALAAALAAVPTAVVGTADAGTPAGFARFYGQKVKWQACSVDDVVQDCAWVSVPVDWADPAGETLALKVTRHRTTGTRKGSLLLNPGGPGASGAQFVATATKAFGKKLVAAYDLVGWDPRGVGESSPLTCPPSATAEFRKAFLPDSVATRRQLERRAVVWAQACRAASGPVFDHVDTVSNARDLDVLRAVLGEKKLSYAGLSYGTRLGLFYADLFPGRIGRMVLDASVDPTTDNAGFWRGASLAAERGFSDYLAGCAARVACPLAGQKPSQARIKVGRLIGAPGPAQDALANTVAALAKAPKTWPELDEVLTAALRGESGTGDDAGPDVANAAINCLDLPDHRTAVQVMADDRRASATRPVFGHVMMAGTLCPQWPVPAVTKPHPVTARGSGPILVVGTTHDTATPYEWAVSTARHLDAGRLLTRKGTGHVAYSRSACVTEAVDGFLVDGVLPAAGKVCAD